MKQLTEAKKSKLELSKLLDHNLRQNSEGYAIWRALRDSDQSIHEFQLVYVNDGIGANQNAANLLIGKSLADLMPENIRYRMFNILHKTLNNHHSKHDYLDIKGVFGWDGTYENIVIPLTHDEVLVKYKNSFDRDSSVDKLHWMLQHDALTEVINRIVVEKLIDEALFVLQTTLKPFVFGIIDIDDFKSINENYGHQIGDEVLRNFLNLLELKLPKDSQVVQMGGDEFAFVLEGNYEIETLKSLARELVISMGDICAAKSTKVNLGFSAGYVLVRNSKFTAKEIYQLAESLMYKVKNQQNHGFLVSVCKNL